MGTAFLLTFLVFFLAQLVSLPLQSNLAMDLRDFHPAAHRSAGRPQPSDFARNGRWNLAWMRYVSLRRFARNPLVPPVLRSAFERVFWCVWIRSLALVALLAMVVGNSTHAVDSRGVDTVPHACYRDHDASR